MGADFLAPKKGHRREKQPVLWRGTAHLFHCRRQIIYSKLNFEIGHTPPYERFLLNHKNVDLLVIKRGFKWNKSFRNKGIDAQTRFSIETRKRYVL